MDLLEWLFVIWSVPLIRAVCIPIGFGGELLHLQQIPLGHIKGRYLGYDEHIRLLDFSHFLLALNELGH